MELLGQKVEEVSRERVVEALKRLGVVYFIDSTGDLGTVYKDILVYFYLAGEGKNILAMHSYPFHDVPIEEIKEFRNFINDWNAASFWPRAFPSLNDSGILRAFCDHCVNCAAGISDAQLEAQITLFFSTVSIFYAELKQKLRKGWR